jgi:3-oxoacyl-[acyl-carrier-protein] synthase-1
MPAISAAIRGTVNVFAQETAYPARSDGAPMLLAAAEPLDPRASWEERLERLTSLAVASLAPALERVRQRSCATTLLLSLPPPRPGTSDAMVTPSIRRITEAVAGPVDGARSIAVRVGHPGALCCLQTADEILSASAPAAVLIAAMDSWIALEALHWLESMRRLKRAGVPNGFVPGEGAACLLLANDAFVQVADLAPLASVRSYGSALESHPWYEGRPCTAGGLSSAIQSVFGRNDDQARTDVTFCDLNGEPWRADEWAFAYLRSAAFHSEPLNIWHPADVWGDAGAATGALLLALAVHEATRDPLLSRALVWSASDVTPHRAAAVIEVKRENAT